MIISLHDSNLSRVCYIDNSLPDAMHYSDDSWNRYLQEATSTFDFKIYKTGNKYESFLNEKNYVSFSYGNSQYLFSIMRTEEDESSIKIYAENLNLELLNETKQPIDITTSNDLVWYLNVNYLIEGSGITVGINEVSDQTRKIKLESEQTGLARLISIANNFDAEIEFVTSLNLDGTLKSLVANFYKKYDGVNYQGVGRDRQDVILEYGRNIESITRTVDKTDIFNTIVPVGKDGVGIESIEQTEYDDKGNVEFYTKAGNKAIYAPISKQLYRAQLDNDKDGWIQRYHTLDGTSDIGTLYTLGLNELRKHAYPAVTYDVKGFFDLNVGDTVRVFDSGFSPILLLKARVAQQTISFSNPSQNKTTFGNIQDLENRISKDITSRLAQLVEEATPYRFEIISSDGLTFKNSEGSTTLTARLYKGTKEVIPESYEWTVNGVLIAESSEQHEVTASDIYGKAVVRWSAVINGVTVAFDEVTITDVSDGVDGISPTVTVNPDTSLTIVDAQGTSTTPVLKGTDGIDGTSGIIVSSVAPTSPQNGQLWQDTSTTPQIVKKWTGSSWVIWELYAQNLKADTLQALSSNIGSIQNDFTLEDGTTGILHIGNSEYRIKSQVLKDNFLFKENIFFDPDGVNFTFEGDSISNSGYGNYSKSGSDFYLQNNKMASYTVSGIRMSNEFAGYRIQIHDATHKMNFVSENGQGFDFTGPVSFNGIPMNTISSVTVASVFGIIFQLTRVGNMVTVNVPVQIVNFIDIGENKKANEVLPLGFRPKTGASFGVFRFANNIAYPVFILAFLNSGEIRFTNTQNGYLSSSGSVSYFTDDAMPVT